MKKIRQLWVGFFFFSAWFLSSCKDRLFDNPLDPNFDKKAYEILTTVPIPGISPVDLSFDGESIWVVDQLSRILRINATSGMVIRELSVDRQVNGIAYDGDGLWLSISGVPQIMKISMVTGSTVRMLNFSKGNFGALDFFDEKLYIADRLSNTVVVINPIDGSIIRSISNRGFSLEGVVFDGSFIWTIDATQMKVYKMSANGDPIADFQTPAESCAGICFHAGSGFTWIGDRSGKLYQLRFQ